jgi:MtaA/CmuA family methyltransferase
MNSKERFLATLQGNPVDRAPVFPLLMFFAQKRLGISYKTFATDGKAMADAQLNIRQKFKIDAITACSDAFRITADLGADIVYPNDSPPHSASPLVRNETDFKGLTMPDFDHPKSRMSDRIKGVREMVKAVGYECMVLGWVDMPFAEACSVCGVAEFMMILFENPPLAHQILSFLTEIVIQFSLRQLEAGAPMIGAGDAAASLVSRELYDEFALPYEQKVCSAIHEKGGLVKLHICGNTTHLMESMAKSGADLFNVDHLADLSKARQIYGKSNLCYKGNLDPVADILDASPESCERKAIDCLKIAAGSRYMLSAGCEIPPGTPDETFEAFCNAPGKGIKY